MNLHIKHAIFILLLYSLHQNLVGSLHLKGKWNPHSDFFLFLTRFGIQKIDNGRVNDTQGFIYGNITAPLNKHSYYTLVLVDSEYFIELYGNRTLAPASACGRMFKKIDKLAWYPYCNENKTEDLLRQIPCPKNALCIDEDKPKNVIGGYQFTFRVQNMALPRYWYLSLVACHRKSYSEGCSWYHNKYTDFENTNIDYDIWLVNGHPASKHLNPFEHQFSFEHHDVFEIFAIFLLCYIVTLPVWIYAYRSQIHKITTLLTVCISTELAGVFFNFLHFLIFAFNGVGAAWLKVIGNLLGTFAECLFMLLLLLIAKGWTITTMSISRRSVVCFFWGVYTGLNALFFIIGLTKINIITNVDEWNAWPGYLIISFRMIIMVWFVLELRATAMRSRHPSRLEFFQQFGAYYLVWFIYLPILVLVATQISYLWRYKTILGITYAADLLSYIIMIHLLWPTRSVLYLIKGDIPLPQYDLDAAGLSDDMEETIFRTPAKSRSNNVPLNTIYEESNLSMDSGSKTNLLESESSLDSPKLVNGRLGQGATYTNISLDDEEEESEGFEVV